VCRKVTKTTPVSDAGQPLTCEERTAEAVARLAPLEAAAAEACTTSDDCVAFPGLSCVGGCGNGVISKAGASAIAGQINSIDTSICGPFTAAGCIAIPPPCPSAGNPACVGGKCQRMLSGQPTDSGTQSCDARATSINDQVFPVLEALDKSCKVNGDCTRVQPNLQCDFGCFVPASKTAASAFEATRAKLDRDLCVPYLADGCTPVLTGCPAVPTEDPHCVKGVCSDVFTVTPDDAGQSCDDRTTALNAELKPVVDSADRACAIDADCKVVMLVDDCIESCTYAPASATGAKSIQDELSTIDAGECPAFKSAGCTVLRLPCVAPPTPRCNAGKCAVQ
jgi:hypothetical protein